MLCLRHNISADGMYPHVEDVLSQH